MYAVVGERRQELLVDRIPQPQLGGNATVEVRQDVHPIGALRGSGQAEKLARLEIAKDAFVARSRGVMELVDDYDVKMIWS